MGDGIKELCDKLRKEILNTGSACRALMDNGYFTGEQMFIGQYAEMKANIMLAYRHLEDARMRLGKVIQAYDGGTSVYDK